MYPLYGLVESGVHWLFINHGHHCQFLYLRPSAFYFSPLFPFLLYISIRRFPPRYTLQGRGHWFPPITVKDIMVMQVDEIIMGLISELFDFEERKFTGFKH